MLTLEEAFRREARRLDAAFLRAHPQAVESGRYDEGADLYRRWANRLHALAREMTARAAKLAP